MKLNVLKKIGNMEFLKIRCAKLKCHNSKVYGKLDFLICQFLYLIKNHLKDITLLVGFLLFIFGSISVSRIVSFLLVLIIIYVYKLIIKNFQFLISKFKKYILNGEFQEGAGGYQGVYSCKEEYLRKGINACIYLHRYKNLPILGIFKFNSSFYNMLYALTKLKYLNNINVINKLYIWIPILIPVNGILIIYNKFYKMLSFWNKTAILDILFKRLFGLILSVLIFTNIIDAIKTVISGNALISIYFLLVMLSILNYGNENYNNSNNKYFSASNLQDKFLNKEMHSIIGMRLQYTITGLFLNSIFNIYHSITEIDKNESYYLEYIYKYQDIKFDVSYNETYEIGLKKIFIYNTNKNGIFYSNKPNLEFYNKLASINYFLDNVIHIICVKYEILDRYNINIMIKEETCIKYRERVLEYTFVLFRLWIYYIGDIESAFGKTQGTFETKCIDHIMYVDTKNIEVTYAYINLNSGNILEHLNNIKANKFWDLYENSKFYKQLYDFVNVEHQNVRDLVGDSFIVAFDKLEEEKNMQVALKYLNDFSHELREDGKRQQMDEYIEKYYAIFQELNRLKEKLLILKKDMKDEFNAWDNKNKDINKKNEYT